jgi:hypothetical protein
MGNCGHFATPLYGPARCAGFGGTPRMLHRPARRRALDFNPTIDYIPIYPALVTEGCLISILRHGAGSGGRGMTLRWRCGEAARRSKPRSVRPAHAAGRQAVDGAPLPKGEAFLEVHRGLRGANLKHRARDALGLADLRFRISTSLDVARRRGPWVRALLVCAICVNLSAPRTPGVPRALGTFRERAAEDDEGVPGADQRIRAMTLVRRIPGKPGMRCVGYGRTPQPSSPRKRGPSNPRAFSDYWIVRVRGR